MKKVIIVGAGVAGLTCGIYLQKQGFETTIYEKNAVAGGELTGWKRNGYTIDNCIHWLTGTLKGTSAYKLWVDVGALGKNVECYENPIFTQVKSSKGTISLYRDLEKTRKELTDFSPEDKEEIDKFIDVVKMCGAADTFPNKPIQYMTPCDIIKIIKSSAPLAKVMNAYKDENVNEFAERFKSKEIRELIQGVMVGEYQTSSLIFSYATIVFGNGDIPMGGSIKMAERMKNRFESLGGKILLSSPVKKILVDGCYASGIQLEDDTKAYADYVVPANDANFTFTKLLDKKYLPKALEKSFEQREKYPVISAFQTAFAVDGVYSELRPSIIFESNIKVGTSITNHLTTKGYDYQPDFAPKGKSVLTSNVLQTEKDFEYWKNLYQNDKDQYNSEKIKTAKTIMSEIEKCHPYLLGHLTLLDVWTPATYERYCNAYHGAYMSFVVTKGCKTSMVSNKIKGLKNVFLATQWLLSPGGLPTAALEGKFAAQYILKSEKLDINI